MSTAGRMRAANALLAARRRAIKAEHPELFAKPVKPKMSVIEGIPGMTATVVYGYRGYTVTRTYQTYDARNKRHNGYWWTANVDGGYRRPTRQQAKDAIDKAVAAKEAATGTNP